MSAHLIYYPRRGVLTGMAAGKHFRLFTRRDGTGGAPWAKLQGLRSAKATLTDYSFELPHESSSDPLIVGSIYIADQKPPYGLPPAKHPASHRSPMFRGASSCRHFASATGAAFVEDSVGGCFIHGWPPCNCDRCIVVLQGMDELLRSLRAEGGGTLRIDFRP